MENDARLYCPFCKTYGVPFVFAEIGDGIKHICVRCLKIFVEVHNENEEARQWFNELEHQHGNNYVLRCGCSSRTTFVLSDESIEAKMMDRENIEIMKKEGWRIEDRVRCSGC